MVLFVSVITVLKFFCVWNPSIKRFKMLPTPNKTTVCIAVNLGFGYDSVSDDYKLVRILLSNYSNVVEAELFSVNANCWKEIELPKAVQSAWPFWHLIPIHAINGVLYMVNANVLVSFDLHTELFEVYPYPDSVKSKRNLTSLVFEGSVAMIFKNALGDGSLYSLWTLDDDCGKMCWTKKFNLEPDLEIDRVDLYLGGGQFVALDFRVSRFFLYDLIKKEAKWLLFPVDYRKILSCVKHTESLVSFYGFEQVEYNGP